MPWLSDDIMNDGSSGHKAALTRQPAIAPEPLAPLQKSDSIKYIPSQMDPLAVASMEAARRDPLRLILNDAGVVLRLFLYVPKILSPFPTRDKDDELYPSFANLKVAFLQTLLALVQLLFLVIVIPAFVCLPGGVFLAGTALVFLICHLITLPMQGPPVNYSNMDDITKSLAAKHKNERWVFINGICTGHSTLQFEIDQISRLFGRAVIGLHNKSYGIFADLGECLIQRAISYHDFGVRLTYDQVKAFLVDPTVSKVVLIGHSQGGIIASLAIDDLLAQLPVKTLSKLEVYTFGSAASHFSNPSLAPASPCATNQPREQSSQPSSLNIVQSVVDLTYAKQGKHIISHMEHYVNEYDLVPRWGVLHSVQDVLETRYAGSVFVRLGASGHMFNQHYLNPMFPLPKCQTRGGNEKRGIKWKRERKAAWDNKVDVAVKLDETSLDRRGHFLDQIVTPDEKLAMRREYTTVVDEMSVKRRESELEFGSGQILKDPTHGLANCKDANGDECLAFRRTASDRIVAENARGKTVKDLSRLWKYLGGESPVNDDLKADGHHIESPREHRKHRQGRHNQAKANGEPGLVLPLTRNSSS